MADMAHHPALLSRLRVTVAGQTREFADAVVALGRDTALPVVVVHPDVSRRHAEFRRGGGGWFLVDLQSTNGTFLGGRRVSHERLPEGQPVQVLLGGTDGAQVLVEVLAAPAAPAGRPSRLRQPGFQRHPSRDRPSCSLRSSCRPAAATRRRTSRRPVRRRRSGTPAYGPPGRPPGQPHDPAAPPYVEPATRCCRTPARRSAPATRPCRSRRPGHLAHGHTVIPSNSPMDQNLSIGRSRTCDIVLDDPLVSRQHATLSDRCGAVPPRPRQLQRHLRQRPPAQGGIQLSPGDEVIFGNQTFTLDRHQPGLARHPGRPHAVRGGPHHGHQGRQAAARGHVLRARPVQPDRGDRAVGRRQVHAARRAHRSQPRHPRHRRLAGPRPLHALRAAPVPDRPGAAVGHPAPAAQRPAGPARSPRCCGCRPTPPSRSGRTGRPRRRPDAAGPRRSTTGSAPSSPAASASGSRSRPSC